MCDFSLNPDIGGCSLINEFRGSSPVFSRALRCRGWRGVLAITTPVDHTKVPSRSGFGLTNTHTCMHICTQHTHTHIHTHSHASTHTRTQKQKTNKNKLAHKHTHGHTGCCTLTDRHSHTQTHTHTHTHTHTFMSASEREMALSSVHLLTCLGEDKSCTK